MAMFSRLSFAVCVAVSVACAAETTNVDYSVSAQINYERGLKELDHKDWNAASQYFAFITRLFPYSKYAVLADLRLADIDLDTGRYKEAVDAYRKFIKSYPADDNVANGYAWFKMGEAYGRSRVAP